VTDEPIDDVVAQVLLRAASGERPGEHVPITAATLDALRPPAGASDVVARYFADHGFAVDLTVPVLVGIRASVAQFDAHFGVELVTGPDGGVTLKRPVDADPRLLPLTALPPAIRSLVATITLEAPMTLDDLDMAP